MYILLSAFLCGISAIVLVGGIYKEKIRFYTTGFDTGFKYNEIALLWKLGKITNTDNPSMLFWSLPTLTNGIAQIVERAQQEGKDHDDDMQLFLAKLYSYRTKIEIEAAEKKGIHSTRDLNSQQKFSIILPGKGVFVSTLLNNGRSMTISIPKKKSMESDHSIWENRQITVYFWRKQDANYAFESKVIGSGLYMGEPVIYITHNDELLRAQKRKSVRAQCHMPGELYLLSKPSNGMMHVELGLSYRCLVEDVSESGALIRVGGKAMPRTKLRLSFSINNELITMFGIVHSVEYNASINQSRLHFECDKLDQKVKNTVLSFVYSTLPQREKEMYEALDQAEKEGLVEEQEEEPEEQPEQDIIIPTVMETIGENLSELNAVTDVYVNNNRYIDRFTGETMAPPAADEADDDNGEDYENDK